jgi:DNA-binding PadR family transcriptional regulator
MSPVFRHGRLRLYLLKLLDESPRHGYEVIRLLQDRFMGVYSPSPGTIYPRLARLEEEGLVTHGESEGRKVYRITEKGREELRNRSDDLTELEDELTASVRDIAREVTEDVRETVRSLREELTWAAREMYGENQPQARGRARASASRGGAATGGAATGGASGDARTDSPGARPGAGERARADRDAKESTHPDRDAKDRAHAARDDAREQAHAARDDAREQAHAARDDAREQAHAAHDDARGRAREARDDARQAAAGAREGARQARGGAKRGRGRHDPTAEGEHGWGSWQDWQAWADWPGRRGWPGPPGSSGWANPGTYRDLERLARRFTRELRTAAWHAQAVSEDALSDLRAILDDALDRIKGEVFGEGTPRAPSDEGSAEHRHDD